MDRKATVFAAMGFECVGLVTACVLIGRYFDQNYGWGGLGAGLGAFVGVMGWVTHLLVVIRSLAKPSEPSDTEPK